LHGDEVLVPHLAEVEHLDDVRMVEERRELRLADEHGDEVGILRVLGKDALDDDDLLEPIGPDGLAFVDLGHAARGDPLGDLVTAGHVCSGYGAGCARVNACQRSRIAGMAYSTMRRTTSGSHAAPGSRKNTE